MNSREIAIATLRRCGEALSRDLSVEERQRLLDLHSQALRVIEHSDSRHRATTWARVDRVQRLEREMLAAGMTPTETARAICARVGIRRSAYFKLRKISR